MANPADLLYNQLEQWRISGDLYANRNLNSSEGWKNMRFAVVNLHNIYILLDRLEQDGIDTSAWRPYDEQLNRSVFGYGVDWAGNSTSDGGVDYHALISLKSLSTVLDMYVPKIQDDGIDQIWTMLNEDLPEINIGEYPYELVTYFKRVKNHLEWCLNHFNEVGEFALSDAITQFNMTVHFMAAGATTDESKKRWSDFLKNGVVYPFISKALVELPASKVGSVLESTGAEVIKALTGG